MKHLAPFILPAVFLLAACGEPNGPPTPDSLRAATILIDPPAKSLYENDTVRFRATVRDSQGATIAGADVRWESSIPAMVTIDSFGLARVLAVQSKTPSPIFVTAMYGRVRATAEVSPVWRAPLNVWPDTNVLFVGMSRTLSPRLIHAASGYPAPNVESVVASSWTSSDPAVVTVDFNGRIIGQAVGNARVTAVLNDGRASAADVFVLPAPSQPLRFIAIGNGYAQIRSAAVNPPFGPDFAIRECGLASDGALYCWGVAMPEMPLTDGCERTVRASPASYRLFRYRCTEIPQRVAPTLRFASLAARGSFGCAVATTRQVYCWGSNASGELGIGTADTSTTHGFTPIAGTGESRSVYATDQLRPGGGVRVCALRTDDAALCWGQAIGSTPRMIAGVTWRMMAEAGSCGLAADSTAYCITNDTASRSGGSARWADIATSHDFSLQQQCALSPAARVYCGIDLGSLVTGEPPIVSIGTSLLGQRLGQASSRFICGLSGDGDLYCVLAANSLGRVDTRGLQLKRMFGSCVITVTDKTYCVGNNLNGLTKADTLRLVPGQ